MRDKKYMVRDKAGRYVQSGFTAGGYPLIYFSDSSALKFSKAEAEEVVSKLSEVMTDVYLEEV